MDKYYTPTIDEFHVGFEYEYLRLNDTNTGWNTKVCDIDTMKALESIKKYLKHPIIRVKSLDKDDIEDLGWKTNIIENIIEFRIELYTLILYTTIDRDRMIVINYSSEPIFIGIIRNKSELKQLMTQLNIKKDGS